MSNHNNNNGPILSTPQITSFNSTNQIYNNPSINYNNNNIDQTFQQQQSQKNDIMTTTTATDDFDNFLFSDFNIGLPP